MRRMNAEASEGTVRIVRRKHDLEYFTHKAQRSVDCRSVLYIRSRYSDRKE